MLRVIPRAGSLCPLSSVPLERLTLQSEAIQLVAQSSYGCQALASLEKAEPLVIVPILLI